MKAPASIANLGPGFDIVATAIEDFYDTVDIHLTPGNGRVYVESHGFDVSSGESNVAYHVTKSFIEKFSIRDYDIHIIVKKGIPPSCGLGSSGATSAAVTYALNVLFNTNLSEGEILYFAGVGEAFTAGSPHYDNVAASLFGGFVILDLSRGMVLKYIPKKRIPVALVIPKSSELTQIKKTAYARSLLPKQISLETHVKQSSSLAKLIYGILMEDLKILGEAISMDYVVEPSRAKIIPFYHEVKKLALSEGAYGVNISGAGPSIFLLHEDPSNVARIAEKIKGYLLERGVEVYTFTTFISKAGVEVVSVE